VCLEKTEDKLPGKEKKTQSECLTGKLLAKPPHA
jgi:hypothetical protein